MRFIMTSLPMKRYIALRVVASVLLVFPLTSVPTHAQEGHAEIEIDFGACTPRRRSVAFPLGSTTIEVAGKAGGRCVMRYGTEIENPMWDGFLDQTCRVPLRAGRVRFMVRDAGVDFSPLKSHCVATPRVKKQRRTKRRASRRRHPTLGMHPKPH
jgi:hypothetical protein